MCACMHKNIFFQTIKFDIKPNKIFVFDGETEERIYFKPIVEENLADKVKKAEEAVVEAAEAVVEKIVKKVTRKPRAKKGE